MSDHNDAVARQEISRVSDLLADLVEVQRAILGEIQGLREARISEGIARGWWTAEGVATPECDARTAAALGEGGKA